MLDHCCRGCAHYRIHILPPLPSTKVITKSLERNFYRDGEQQWGMYVLVATYYCLSAPDTGRCLCCLLEYQLN